MYARVITIFVFIVIDLIFIFYRTRKSEPNKNGDDMSTPDIVENRFGDYCQDCGNTIEARHTYCDNCGKKVR